MRRLSTNARVLAGIAFAAALVVGVTEWRVAANLQAQLEAVAYYRVKSSYIVRDTGEHMDFDYVAACAVLETRHRDGDRSVDTPFGVAPNTFIMRTSGGHAIQVATPRACNREAEHGDIPPDLIPLTVFYEDATKLGFGWGYTSQDAYDNARARISFEGASVTAATYADWRAWRAQAAEQPKMFGGFDLSWGYSKERDIPFPVASSCAFYVRAPVHAEIRAAVTAEWEKRGRPEFWVYGDGRDAPEFLKGFRKHDTIFTYLQPRTKGGGVGRIGFYARQREAKQRWDRDDVYPSNETYPYLPISLATTPPPGLDARVFPTRVQVSDEWKGLAACGINDPVLDDLFWGRRYRRSHGNIDLDRGEGEPIGDRTQPVLVNDTAISEFTSLFPPQLIFQRDEFTLRVGSGPFEGVL